VFVIRTFLPSGKWDLFVDYKVSLKSAEDDREIIEKLPGAMHEVAE